MPKICSENDEASCTSPQLATKSSVLCSCILEVKSKVRSYLCNMVLHRMKC